MVGGTGDSYLKGDVASDVVAGLVGAHPEHAAEEPPNFHVTLSIVHARAAIHVRGELDMAAVPELSAQFAEACAQRPSLVVFDLAELTYCDSSGIRALLSASAECAKNGFDMRVIGVRANVRRIFEITHVVEVLNLTDR